MSDERWLRVRTVSRRLDLHFRTVYRYIEAGRFGPDGARQLVSGEWRIAESALDRIMAQSGATCTSQTLSQAPSS